LACRCVAVGITTIINMRTFNLYHQNQWQSVSLVGCVPHEQVLDYRLSIDWRAWAHTGAVHYNCRSYILHILLWYVFKNHIARTTLQCTYDWVGLYMYPTPHLNQTHPSPMKTEREIWVWIRRVLESYQPKGGCFGILSFGRGVRWFLLELDLNLILEFQI
jgi:hypothetical protein